MKNNQKGFGVVEMLIVLVVLGLIGGVGWFIYSRRDRDPSPQSIEPLYTQNHKEDIQVTTDPDSLKETIDTDKITNKKFSVNLPSNWNYRACSDHDGLGALVSGGGGDMRCIWDDATWLSPGMATQAKVAIGYGINPYPRQDFSSGRQKDVYETDAKELKLSDGRTAKQYSYSSEEVNNKGKIFRVVEYTVDDKVSVFVFDDHSSESGYINDLSTKAILKIIEETVLPSIKLL